MKQILFLDVDGVLNRCGRSHERLEPDLVQSLCRIVDATDCTLVISSTWRCFPSAMAELEYTFTEHGLRIHSCTPDLCREMESGLYTAKCRGDEIQEWMKEYGTPERFCIVDDNSDMGHLLPCLVQTDSFHGLTPHHERRIIEMLSPE